MYKIKSIHPKYIKSSKISNIILKIYSNIVLPTTKRKNVSSIILSKKLVLLFNKILPNKKTFLPNAQPKDIKIIVGNSY